MGKCVTSGSLKVLIQESIRLPNKNEEVCINEVIIPDVNQIMRRTDTISTTFSGSGIEILRFVDSEEQQTAGSFVRDTVKYMRFTNLCDNHFCSLYLIQDSPNAQNPNTTDFGSGDDGLFRLDPGKSIVFSNGQFDSNNYYDYVVEGYVDEQYIGGFASLSLIKAKADTSDVQIEYFVASS
tara:strand:- start:913 stop:1455 length:543 start_codon:yes stop_codon:yes gene_type:complete